jgi:Fe-S cluster assembly protein SufD
MSDFIESALLRSPGDVPPWMADFNASGRNNVQGKVLPNIKVEEWKYTSLRALKDIEFASAPEPVVESDASLQGSYVIDGLAVHSLVFVNGQFSESLSAVEALPAGVSLVPFSQATDREAEDIGQNLGMLAGPDAGLFPALNASWLSEGVFLRVASGVTLETPVQVVWLSTGQTQTFGISQRLLVQLEENSEATVIEHFAGTDEAPDNFCNGVSEFLVADNARLNHFRLHLENPASVHIGSVHIHLGREARLNGFHMALGGQLKRIDINVEHRGEGAYSELNGVYLPRNREHVDYHTTVEHAVPNCASDETFRGIVSDQARAVFNGRIHIHPGACKTQAHLSNKNLLTSNTAEVDTKPELEIYNDDVQCSHGATVAQIDSKQLHYLRTRGVSAQEARVLLSFGFINELLGEVSLEPLRNYLRPQLAALFATDDNLTRHLL